MVDGTNGPQNYQILVIPQYETINKGQSEVHAYQDLSQYKRQNNENRESSDENKSNSYKEFNTFNN